MAIAFAASSPSHLQTPSSLSLCSSSSPSSSASCSHSLRLTEPTILPGGQTAACRSFISKCSTAETLEGRPSLSTPHHSPRRIVGKGSKLVGCGSATPQLSLSNDYLSKIVDTNDEWISVRTGIRNRKVLSDLGSRSIRYRRLHDDYVHRLQSIHEGINV